MITSLQFNAFFKSNVSTTFKILNKHILGKINFLSVDFEPIMDGRYWEDKEKLYAETNSPEGTEYAIAAAANVAYIFNRTELFEAFEEAAKQYPIANFKLKRIIRKNTDPKKEEIENRQSV